MHHTHVILCIACIIYAGCATGAPANDCKITGGAPTGFTPWEVDPDAARFEATPSLSAKPSPVGYGRALLGVGFTMYHQVSRFDMTRCQMSPTCSHFARDVLGGYGVVQGVPLVFARLMRGHGDLSFYEVDPKTGGLIDEGASYRFSRDAKHRNGPAKNKAHAWHKHIKGIELRGRSPRSLCGSSLGR